jgi:PAS domain S-box-containing protein
LLTGRDRSNCEACVIPPWYVHEGPQTPLAASPEGSKFRLLLSLLFAAAVLAVALRMPRGFATSLFYIPLVLCGLTFSRPNATLLLAAIATLLSQFVYLSRAPTPVGPWVTPAHQVMLVITLWLTALLVFQHRKSLLRLQTAQNRAAFLASIVECTDDAVIGITATGIIHSWNNGAEKMFGFRADERIGQPVGLLIPEFRAIDDSEIEDRLRRQIGLRNFETKCICKNGAPLDVTVTASPILDGKGNFIGISEILRDNTESRTMLERVRQSESRFQSLVRGLNVGEWDWNVVTNELFWSQRFLEIIGITETDFVPHFAEFESRLHPEDTERVLGQLESHVHNATPFDTEYRLRRQNGSYAWIHATGQCIWDENGRATRVVGSVDDITDRKLAEERFEKIVEFSPYPIIVIDSDGEIVLTNRQTEQLFGYQGVELLQKNVDLLIPDRFRARDSDPQNPYFPSRALPLQETLPMGRGTELFALRKDGSEAPVEIGLIPIQTATASYVLCSIIDITPRLEAEAHIYKFQEDLKRQVAERTHQLAASNRELEDFAAFASHDLKAPLRGIRAIVEFLDEDLEPHLTAASRGHMNQLNVRVQRMEKLLDDLLEYARISDPDISKTGGKIRGDALMREIIGLLEPPSRFTINLSGPFPDIILRRMPLQQVLMNLLGNAIKHHDKPVGNLGVAVQDDGAEYCFTVTDDGPGIAKKFQDRVFKMFQTLKPRDQVEGSGMGLAVVRKHVHCAGGVLTLESEENAGCVFRFTWPK